MKIVHQINWITAATLETRKHWRMHRGLLLNIWIYFSNQGSWPLNSQFRKWMPRTISPTKMKESNLPFLQIAGIKTNNHDLPDRKCKSNIVIIGFTVLLLRNCGPSLHLVENRSPDWDSQNNCNEPRSYTNHQFTLLLFVTEFCNSLVQQFCGEGVRVLLFLLRSTTKN